MAPVTALYDACVLYPAPLRDLLMWVALTDLVRAKWTDEIHEEWMRSVLQDRPDLTRSQLERTRDLMNANIRDCLVEDYADLIPALNLPDPDDRHVLAAAIRGRVDVLVTFNLRDYPPVELGEYGIEVLHPDDFVHRLLVRSPMTVLWAVRKQQSTLKNPPVTMQALLSTLEKQGLRRFVQRLRETLGIL